MMNSEMMTLKLTRLEMLDIRMALTNNIHRAKRELYNENTTADRKKVLEVTVKKWTDLREEVVRQFNEQDAE